MAKKVKKVKPKSEARWYELTMKVKLKPGTNPEEFADSLTALMDEKFTHDRDCGVVEDSTTPDMNEIEGPDA